MPNKTIYVADQDLPILERAQSLSGENQSATIMQALRHFVENLESRAQGFHTVEVETGSVTFTRKRFTGRLIAAAHVAEDRRHKKKVMAIMGGRNGHKFQGMRTLEPEQATQVPASAAYEKYEIYQTPRGNLALHVEAVPSRNSTTPHEKRLEVYANTDEMKAHIPDDLYQYLLQTLKGDEAEVLDI